MADVAPCTHCTHHELGGGVTARAHWEGEPTARDLEAVEAVAAAAAKMMAEEDAQRDAQIAMRSGPRRYTDDQARVIADAARLREPLDIPPLPVEEACGCGATADGEVVHALDCPRNPISREL